MEKTEVYCPILKEKIDLNCCYDIVMVVECGAPAWSATPKALDVEGFKQICTSCPIHKEYYP